MGGQVESFQLGPHRAVAAGRRQRARKALLGFEIARGRRRHYRRLYHTLAALASESVGRHDGDGGQHAVQPTLGDAINENDNHVVEEGK